MIRIYRLDELRAKYSTHVHVLESDGGWYVRLQNPFNPDWWASWCGPRWTGMRWLAFKHALRLLTIERLHPITDKNDPRPRLPIVYQ
jgi:hypothetical protein